jgi:hypothetical protein
MEDSVKNIRGVNPKPKGSESRQMGRAQVAGGSTEVIRPSKYPDGQDRMGTPAGMENTSARTRHYLHPESVQHRRELGSQPPAKTKF